MLIFRIKPVHGMALAFMATFFIGAPTASNAQMQQQKRQEIEHYMQLKEQCDAGNKQACIKEGQIQGAVGTNLKGACQHGDKVACDKLQLLQDRQRQRGMQ